MNKININIFKLNWILKLKWFQEFYVKKFLSKKIKRPVKQFVFLNTMKQWFNFNEVLQINLTSNRFYKISS